jgi:hypothetical protein
MSAAKGDNAVQAFHRSLIPIRHYHRFQNLAFRPNPSGHQAMSARHSPRQCGCLSFGRRHFADARLLAGASAHAFIQIFDIIYVSVQSIIGATEKRALYG